MLTLRGLVYQIPTSAVHNVPHLSMVATSCAANITSEGVMPKSKYIEENSAYPYEATLAGLDAGAAQITIVHNNGAVEVTNANGAILMQAKNVKAGAFDAIWEVLNNCGDIDYRA
jgi:hypothetical protein